MIQKALFTSNTEERATPEDLFNKLNKKFKFTLDPCSTEENHKCDIYYTKKENWLIQDRNDQIVFVNPPYWKEIWKRVEKGSNVNKICVMLLPARTDTKRFQDIVLKKASRIHFIKWRLKFWGSKNSAPFPSVIVVFDNIQKKEDYTATLSYNI